MNFQQNSGKSISQAFDEYHKANPDVYEHFIRLALTAIRKGKTKLSSKMIINVIRWEIYLQTEEQTLFSTKGEEIKFKINDAYTSRYARLFIQDYPKYEKMFDFRELRSA